ncbi:MAG: DUF2235 domain-containing protein [Sphingorhabdus sp.]
MRRLVFCFDGSWNALDIEKEPTNVLLVAESIVPIGRDDVVQIVHYDEGVGTSSDDTIRGGAFGFGLDENVREAFRFLIFNYQPGDEIFVFGFSRGAFSARSFVGFLEAVTILDKANARRIKEAWELYKNHSKEPEKYSADVKEFRKHHCRDMFTDIGDFTQMSGLESSRAPKNIDLLKIRYVGVWDTVGSLGWKVVLSIFDRRTDKQYRNYDTSLSKSLESGRHAVALDEKRVLFAPTLWNNVEDLNRRVNFDGEAADAPFQQLWFAGDHGSVGGGGSVRGLSNAALHWILKGAVSKGMKFNLEERSQLKDIRYDHRTPLHNTPKLGPQKNMMGVFIIGWLMEKLKSYILSSPRSGPSSVSEIHPSALRRVFADDLPEGRRYCPTSLKHKMDEIRACKDTFAPPADPDSYFEHEISKGDLLSALAKRYLHKSSRYPEIFEINRDRIDHPDDVFPGDKIRIPKL